VAHEATLVVDPGSAAPGRGTYLCGAGCAGQARRRGAFARRLRQAVRVPDDLEKRLEELPARGPQRR
jgi:predicted RNA-binding protein YlxR (DUF448 family)